MVALLDTPTQTEPQVKDFAAEVQAARQKLAECDTAIGEWQNKLRHAEQQAIEVEQAAGDAVLVGTPINEAGGRIAAAKAAVSATQRGLDAAKRSREQAYISTELARAAELRHKADLLTKMLERQKMEMSSLVDAITARDGFCFLRWRELPVERLPGLLSEAVFAEQNAHRRQAELDKQR